MTFFEGLKFFLVLAIGLLPAIVLGMKEKSIKYYALGFSIVLILMICTADVTSFIYLVVFYILEWHVIKVFLFLRKKYGKHRVLYAHFIILATAPVVLSKVSSLIHINIFAFIGVSYVSFKVIQIIIESYDGLIEDISFFDYSSFILFFPSLSSGPIDRSRRYLEDIHTIRPKSEYLELVGIGLAKITLGLFYKFALAGIAYTIVSSLKQDVNPLMVIAYAYAYGIYMFFDFAGYSNMAIGTSYILGVKTPENFDKPFISIDIKDFWNRWHITLSHWFRDFIFSRFMIASIKKKRFSNRLHTAVAGFIVNMFVMGLWHGPSMSYILYGLYHGVLLGATEIYQKKSKFYKKHKTKKWYKVVSWALTINLVMFGFLIFSGRFLVLTQAVSKWLLINL